MNRFAFDTAMSYLHTSSYKIETFKNQYNETSITASSPMQKNGSKRLLPRIGLVSIPYHSRIILRSSFVAPFFVVLSFSLPEAETIRKQYGSDITWKGGGYVEGTWRIGGGRALTTKITVSARR